MKTIVLIPVKNEEWILEQTLKNTSPYVDTIIIADQSSTDKTVEICGRFSNVRVIHNPLHGHSNQVRWLLLEEARKIDGEKLIICIDADEMIAPKGIEEMKRVAATSKAVKGDVFKLQWIQLWQDIRHYRNDGVWANSFKNIAFIDSEGISEYKKDFVINDHTSRVPDTYTHKEISISYPFLHFHFVAWERTQLKQAWYRCAELIKGLRNAKRINNTYRVTLMPKNLKILSVPKQWTEGLIIDEQKLQNVSGNWHAAEIMAWFNQYSIEFFEDLQIWHIEKLHDEFIKRTGREPKSRVYPNWLVALNEVKNAIKNFHL